MGTVFVLTDAIGGIPYKLQCYVLLFFISFLMGVYFWALFIVRGWFAWDQQICVYKVSLCLLCVWFELRL